MLQTFERADLDLKTTLLLDRVQKHQPISKDASAFLKKNRLVEGRYPNLYIASQVADITGDHSSYVKYRAFDDKYYKDMIILYLEKKGVADRKEINDLLIDKISVILGEKQKLNKIRNLLYAMSKKDKKIKNIGSAKKPRWVLA